MSLPLGSAVLVACTAAGAGQTGDGTDGESGHAGFSTSDSMGGPDSSESDGDDATGTSLDGGSTDGVVDTGTADDSSSSGSSSAGEAGGDSGDGGWPAGRVRPLELERSWTFALASGELDFCAGSGPWTVENVSSFSADGVVGVERSGLFPVCGSGPLFLAADGEQGTLRHRSEWDPPWAAWEPAPVDGLVWTDDDGAEYEWESTGQVTVPAGTFEGCWTKLTTLQGPGGMASYEEVLCPGVGPVRLARTQFDPLYALELQSWSP